MPFKGAHSVNHPLAPNGIRERQIEAITGLEQAFAEDRSHAFIRRVATEKGVGDTSFRKWRLKSKRL
jgi:hypothetical protein